MKINLGLSLILLFLFCNINTGQSQSKFEFGIGFNINHSDIQEDIRTSIGMVEGIFKGTRLPGISTRVGYKMNDKFHMNINPGFSWIGALLKDNTARTTATTFELPLQLEWNLTPNIQVTSGPIYNYVIAITNETDQTKMDGISAIDSRHQIGLKSGIAYSVKLIELSLSYTPYFTNLYNSPIIDVNGNDIGSVQSKFRNIQLGILFRG